MTTAELTQHLKAEALRLGFDRVGIAPAVSPPATRILSTGSRPATVRE